MKTESIPFTEEETGAQRREEKLNCPRAWNIQGENICWRDGWTTVLVDG